MVKHVKAAKSVPALPPRPALSSDLGEPGFRGWGVFPFPPQNRLVITTTKGVYVWDVHGITEIFRSSSKGIVAARKLTSDNGMLAVADSQVVIIHEVKGGTQKSYRLKGSQGRVRLLKYAKDLDSLFFTTDLQNSVQSYSLRDSKLLTMSHDHPTAPSVFAISCNSQFLLSTSVSPPTIHLTDLSLNMLPILVRPQCSSSAVVAATFHPERVGYFLLAFSDGTAAVFDATHFFRKQDRQDHVPRAAVSGAVGPLAFMKGLHAHGTSTGKLALENGVNTDGVDPGTGVVGIGDKSWGFTAIAFVPGRKATVVTAGADGKCCVVDFTQTTKQKAVLLKTWHLRRPATSISVIYSPRSSASSQMGGIDHVADEESGDASCESDYTPNKSYYIAVGRQDGRVLLFDLNGKSLGEQTLDEGGAPVIDVEWTQLDNGVLASRRNSSPVFSKTSYATPERKPLGAIIRSPNHPIRQEEELTPSTTDKQPRDSLFDFSTPNHIPQEQPSNHVSAAVNHLDTLTTTVMSMEGSIVSDATTQISRRTPAMPVNKTVHREMGLESVKSQSDTTSSHTPNEEYSPPPVPPRPTPRPGGLLSMRRTHTDYSYQAPADDSYLSLIVNARKLRNNLSLKAKGSFGPRPMRRREGGSPLKSAMSSDYEASPEQSEVACSDVPPQPPPHGTRLRSKSPTASIESFQTASSQVDASSSSEKSTDTVVDWDVGQPRQPIPSLEEEPQANAATNAQKTPKQKGHISISDSSTSPDRSTPTSIGFPDTAHPIVQWPAFSPRYSGLGLHAAHAAHASDKSPIKPKSKGKVHLSAPLSSDSYDSTAPASSTSGDLLVQWPSLKKSPRIPELNKALSFSEQDTSIKSARESATGFVLQTYTEAASPPKAPAARSAVKEFPTKGGHADTCAIAVEATLNASLSTFRAEMAQRFDEQRMWLEKVIKGDGERKMELEKENRQLRAEISRLNKDLGRTLSEQVTLRS